LVGPLQAEIDVAFQFCSTGWNFPAKPHRRRITLERRPMGSLCFVMMPFGRKRDGKGREIDFDAVYAEIVLPAIEAAGLEPIRADEGHAGGVLHKPMLERLILCDVMIADLTQGPLGRGAQQRGACRLRPSPRCDRRLSDRFRSRLA
jgi:hypothetical protein